MEESPNVQVQSASTAQAASHPSPVDIPPSSQYPAVGFMTSPSPQTSLHTEAVEESPSVQEYPVSTAQVEEHPSLSAVLESSQYPAIGAIENPSPHTSVQILAVEVSPKVHSQFASTAHEASHPSLAVVPPSSQYPAVGFTTAPSPQISVHTAAVEESPRVQDQNVSTAQEASQPSPVVVPPSSQLPEVGFIMIPSPQVSVQTEAVEESPKVQV